MLTCALPMTHIHGRQPDLSTRLFVKMLKDTLKIPILALVDSDPYGLKILSVYVTTLSPSNPLRFFLFGLTRGHRLVPPHQCPPGVGSKLPLLSSLG